MGAAMGQRVLPLHMNEGHVHGPVEVEDAEGAVLARWKERRRFRQL